MESCPSNNDANDIADVNDIVGPEGLLTKYFLGATVSGFHRSIRGRSCGNGRGNRSDPRFGQSGW